MVTTMGSGPALLQQARNMTCLTRHVGSLCHFSQHEI